MRKMYLFLAAVVLCCTLTLHAQTTVNAKTVNLTAAGTLSTVLSTTELNSVTKLTLSGTIDARDFKTMRDAMPMLEDIDLREANIVAYEGTEGTVNNVATVYAANKLPEYAFAYELNYNYTPNTLLKSIQLPNTVTTIGKNSFHTCKNLSEIIIPNTVTTLEFGVFFDCSALSSVSLSNTLSSISMYAFASCTSLKQIVIPSSVTSITQSAFIESGLTSITIPNGVTSIDNYAFERCGDLATVAISGSVTTISKEAFSVCYSLSSITVDEANTQFASVDGVLFSKDKKTLLTCPAGKKGEYIIPNSVTKIGERAFSCAKYLTAVTIPNSVTELGNGAFIACSGLTGITIPESITAISNSAFQDCGGLVTINLPATLTSIGDWGFSSCAKVTELTIPASVTSLGNGSITIMTGLQSLTVYQTTPIDIENTAYMFDNIDKTIPLYVPAGAKALYAAAAQWNEFTNIIELSCEYSKPTILAKEATSTQTLTVTANTNWTATTTADWLDVTPTTTVEGNGTINIKAKSANAGAARTAMITLSAAGVSTQLITVTQASGVVTDATFASKSNSAVLYPNPTKDNFALTTNADVTVFVYSGTSLLFSKNLAQAESVSLVNYPTGNYIVVVKSATETSSHLLVKE